jgi:hypothetical protein
MRQRRCQAAVAAFKRRASGDVLPGVQGALAYGYPAAGEMRQLRLVRCGAFAAVFLSLRFSRFDLPEALAAFQNGLFVRPFTSLLL